MSKKTFASSLLAVVLLFAFVQHHTAANAGLFDWSTLVAEQAAVDEPAAVDSNTDGTTKDSADASTKKGGNGFVRVLSAPFRALGRLFGGGVRRMTSSSKRVERAVRTLTNSKAPNWFAFKMQRHRS